MRLPAMLISGICFAAAAGLSLVVAGFAATGMERISEIAVRQTLDEHDFGWAEVTADGLRVVLEGTAPDEATRFGALSQVGTIVDAARVIDEMQVKPSLGIAPPQFSAEILRNDAGISIIGLVPSSTDRDDVIDQLTSIDGTNQIADFLESTAYAPPAGWTASMRFGLKALDLLPSSKISIKARSVAITATTNSVEEKQRIEARLNRMAPAGLHLSLDIAAPRPVITPFNLRYTLDETGGRFDACSAESEASRDRILRAARQAGLPENASCTIGLGVPSPNWAQAVELSLESLTQLGQGTVTFANADIALTGVQGTDQVLFDRVAARLETALPKVFALHAVLPKPQSDEGDGQLEFIATLSPEGQVLLRGRISDDSQRALSTSFAKARFGVDNVHNAARIAEDVPPDWTIRILSGVQALSHLRRGAVTVTPEMISVRGSSYDKDATAVISRLFSTRLGQAETYALEVAYEEAPIPEDQPLTPQQCQDQLTNMQDSGKIAFEPGSATVAAGSNGTLDQIAQVLEHCGAIRLEIQGHTDSQGRETMNQQLSQARAQSILNEMRARRIPTLTFEARGYGETQPIADNDTANGREANRRIVFKLMNISDDDDTAQTDPDAAGSQAEPEQTDEGSDQ